MLFTFIKYLIQLLLAPDKGWEDVERDHPDCEALIQRGLYPLIGIASVTVFAGFFYMHDITLAKLLMQAVVVFGAYFITIFVARLIFDMYLPAITENCEKEHSQLLIIMGVGLMVLFQIIENFIPWNLVILKFLPFYAVLVLYKSDKFVGLRKGDEFRFIGLISLALVIVPLSIYYILYLIVV